MTLLPGDLIACGTSVGIGEPTNEFRQQAASPEARGGLRDDRQRLEATNDRRGAPLQVVSRTGEPQFRQASQ